ncbi:terminase, partial [Clostridium tertium]|nr:terminase [Clostridium tertium]
MDRKLIKLGAKCELARREFFFYCNLMAPDFYKKNRKYLIELCNEFQEFYESDDEVLIINEPPRHGKSRTASLFVEWVLGKNQNEKIMTGSYNETLSTMFSKNVRNAIQEEKADKYKPVFSDVFPNVRIKQGDGAMNLWSLEGGYNNYLATSPTGTA